MADCSRRGAVTQQLLRLVAHAATTLCDHSWQEPGRLHRSWRCVLMGPDKAKRWLRKYEQ